MIKAENLCLKIQGNVILDDVSFKIDRGEYVGLIGPNGAGKTSLIKTILGVEPPTSGQINVAPKVKIGYVPQSNQLSNVVPISVLEVLKMSGKGSLKELTKELETVGLDKSFLSKNFHQLSGGQKQRVIIARALCQVPDLIIFDEPLNGVDFETKIKIYTLLAKLNQSKGITILFVSHEVDHIIDKCDHILCLNRTMHTGCHPLDFAQGKINGCPVLATSPQVIPVHHHHKSKAPCSC